jgi:hypothetical protein
MEITQQTLLYSAIFTLLIFIICVVLMMRKYLTFEFDITQRVSEESDDK